MNLSLDTNEVMRVQMKDIWKRFPGVIANQGINLDLKAGEVHALLGENGAGKTTIMRMLAGYYRLDAGQIFIEGSQVDIHSPKDAMDLGIGMIHQHFQLVDNMTVAENLHLGWDKTSWNISRKKLAASQERVCAEFGFSLNPHDKIWQLSVGEQQRCEIIQALSRGVKILIMDEPTAVLTPQEADNLFTAMRDLAAKGKTIVFISHKLDEILQVSDRVTVLRQGKNVETSLTSECDRQILVEMMVGRGIDALSPKKRKTTGSTILKVMDVKALNDRGLPALKDINFDVKAGEILGIAGVSGNGQTELAEVITGLRLTQSGSILIKDKNVTNKNPREYTGLGVGHIPEDRIGMGLMSSLSLTHNAILREFQNPPIRKGIRLIRKEAEKYAKKLIDIAHVRTVGVNALISTLSGGNQQKFIVQRELNLASSLLVAVHPTRGLDVGAIENVNKTILEHAENGCAVILFSDDINEIQFLSDRIAVMFAGEIMDILTKQEATCNTIGKLMGGCRDLEE